MIYIKKNLKTLSTLKNNYKCCQMGIFVTYFCLVLPFKSQSERLCQVFCTQYSVFSKLFACSCQCWTMPNCALCTTVVLNEVITNPSTILHPWRRVRRDVLGKTKQHCIVLHQRPGLRLNRVFPVRAENRSNTSPHWPCRPWRLLSSTI